MAASDLSLVRSETAKPIQSSEVVKLLYKTMTRDAAAAASVPDAELKPVSEINPGVSRETGT